MAPGRRRIYSNTGIERAAELLADARRDAVRRVPRGRRRRAARARRAGSPARRRTATAARSTTCSRSAASCSRRRSSPAETLAEATAVQFPGLAGVLPGWGRMEPNDWGLAFELRDGKSPHWTGTRNSPRTFGHFGATGTFLWVDPAPGLRLRRPHRPAPSATGRRRRGRAFADAVPRPRRQSLYARRRRASARPDARRTSRGRSSRRPRASSPPPSRVRGMCIASATSPK